ncbi:MAG: DUF805 domain-containing protein [Gammaproteobacteria bacterium]|jgi:uncharacterized membrane protein YhaH (DUF805 family)|nr:DUF805 domain-containing protein [Gammaproteobacteria bacterium]
MSVYILVQVMRYFLNIYIKFQGKLNRPQFIGAFIFYIFLLFTITVAGYALYHVIESEFVSCPQTSVDLRLEPNGPIVGTLITPDCHKNTLPLGSTSLSGIEKAIGFCLSLLLSFVYMYPLVCLCVKRFQDIGFHHPTVPIVLILVTEIIDQLLFSLINAKSGLSMTTEIIILSLCIFLPTKFYHQSVSSLVLDK